MADQHIILRTIIEEVGEWMKCTRTIGNHNIVSCIHEDRLTQWESNIAICDRCIRRRVMLDQRRLSEPCNKLLDIAYALCRGSWVARSHTIPELQICGIISARDAPVILELRQVLTIPVFIAFPFFLSEEITKLGETECNSL